MDVMHRNEVSQAKLRVRKRRRLGQSLKKWHPLRARLTVVRDCDARDWRYRSGVHQFPRAAATGHHNWVRSENSLFLSQFRRSEA